MKALLLKVDSQAFERWQKQANESGITMSEWIRRSCNDACMGQFTVVEHEPIVYESPKVKADNAEFARRACKHGLLFCKTCK